LRPGYGRFIGKKGSSPYSPFYWGVAIGITPHPEEKTNRGPEGPLRQYSILKSKKSP
jgi:hypothetical protein